MMDIDKLIERLYQHDKDYGEGRTQDFFRVCLDCKDAATALSTLRAENDQLRSGPLRLQTERDTLLAANQHLREERERLTAERDDARATLDWFRRHGIRED